MPTINQLVLSRRQAKHHTCNIKALNKCPQKKGICIKIRIVKPKKPNSAQRKIVKVKIKRTKNVLVAIPGQGHTLKSFFTVMVSGGRANDLPGVRFTLIRGKYDFSVKENFVRVNARSKYGISKMLLLANYNDFSEDDEL